LDATAGAGLFEAATAGEEVDVLAVCVWAETAHAPHPMNRLNANGRKRLRMPSVLRLFAVGELATHFQELQKAWVSISLGRQIVHQQGGIHFCELVGLVVIDDLLDANQANDQGDQGQHRRQSAPKVQAFVAKMQNAHAVLDAHPCGNLQLWGVDQSRGHGAGAGSTQALGDVVGQTLVGVVKARNQAPRELVGEVVLMACVHGL